MYKLVFLILIPFLFEACVSNKKLFYERFEDGSAIGGVEKKCKKPGIACNQVQGVYSHRAKKLHYEYIVHKYDCDSIFKKICRKGCKLLMLKDTGYVDYPFTDTDRMVLNRLFEYTDSANACYRERIGNPRGFIVIRE